VAHPLDEGHWACPGAEGPPEEGYQDNGDYECQQRARYEQLGGEHGPERSERAEDGDVPPAKSRYRPDTEVGQKPDGDEGDDGDSAYDAQLF
jgi:hypothetical protein